MTNETTASQPCPTCGGSKVDPGGLPVCRTCSASQPKSIGDDAQFRALMINVIEANSENYEAYDFCSSKLYAYLDSKLRAPAAQASATIQAAPEGRLVVSTDVKGDAIIVEVNARQSDKMTPLYSRKHCLNGTVIGTEIIPASLFAATIQEPVMVAEPVGGETPYSCETGQIDEALANFLAEHTRLNQDGIDEHAMTMTLALNYAAINPTPAEDISRWYEQGYLSDAAPMVADPAGVACGHNYWDLGVASACPECGVRLQQLAATVKAVPSEAMPITQEPKYGIRDNRLFNRASGEFIPADEPVFIFRARDFHAADAIGWYAGDVRNAEHYRAVSERVAQFRKFADEFPDRMKESDTANFAAPLADKTGGGE